MSEGQHLELGGYTANMQRSVVIYFILVVQSLVKFLGKIESIRARYTVFCVMTDVIDCIIEYVQPLAHPIDVPPYAPYAVANAHPNAMDIAHARTAQKKKYRTSAVSE